MIVEVGLFRIDPARAEEFAPVAQDIRGAFARGDIAGLEAFHIAPAIEDPGRWTVLVTWGSVADHERFVASPEGERQRVLLGRFMTEPAEVFHVSLENGTGRFP
jgi:heme-degrading monooxygenase HmoA